MRRIQVVFVIFLAMLFWGLCGCEVTDTLESGSDTEFNGSIEESIEDVVDANNMSVNNTETEEMTEAEPSIESVKLVTKIKYANGSYREYEYDAYGQCLKEMYYSETGTVNSYKVYEYDEAGRCLSELEYDGEEVLCNSHTMVYDEFGNCIQYFEYDEDGKIKAQHGYEYDKSGNVVKDIEYYISDGEISKVIEFSYDENNKLIQEKLYVPVYGFESPRDITTYKYDGNGNLVEELIRYDLLSFDPSSTRYEYIYNENNQLLMKTKYESRFDIVDHKMEYYVYEYDENGNMIKEEYYILAIGLARIELMGDGTATLRDSVEYVYDEEGDVVEKIFANIDNNNDITGYTSFFYEYQYTDIIVR